MMDQLARHYLGIVFKMRYLDARGDEFQKFFGKIMNLRYLGDFSQTRPWGPLGDNKCDGYLPSQRKFYQCYAPDELTQSETLKKLNTDFNGALPHHPQYFDSWVFVHNARDGRIPSWLALELENLRQTYQQISIETLGYYELQQEVLSLEDSQLVDLFGPLTNLRDVLAVTFEDIRPILDHVARNATPDDSIPRVVPPKKIEYNKLSQDVEYCLRQGLIKSEAVRNYLDQTPDKELAAKVTKAFREKYDEIKDRGLDPDAIFFALRIFAQGHFSQMPRTEGAVFAVLAYLFEECDIFENPPG